MIHSSDNPSDPVDDRPAATVVPTPRLGTLDARNGHWQHDRLAMGEYAESAGGLGAYAHALRRHWFLALGSGLLVAGLLAAAAWYSQPERYTATAQLRIASSQQRLVFQTTEHTAQTAFSIYKNTQQQLLRSRFVLNAALRHPQVARLDDIQQQIDPVRWLADELTVSFPGDAEIMQISLQGDKPADLALIVNAIVDAYMEEVVHSERNGRLGRLADLERVFTEAEDKLRSRRADLKRLVETLGSGDRDALTVKQQIALQQFGAYRDQHTRVQFELMQAQIKLAKEQARLKSFDEVELTEEELEAYAQTDPVARTLWLERIQIASQLAAAEAVAVDDNARVVGRYRRALEDVDENMNRLREALRERLKRERHAEVEAALASLKDETAILLQQQQQLAQSLEELTREAEQIGRSSVDVELMHSEIARLDGVINRIGEEIETTRIELQSGSRINLLQGADAPKRANDSRRMQLTAVLAVIGFLVPVVVVVWWDARSQRINTVTDVSRGLGVPLMGSVPIIPARIVRRLDSPARRVRRWHAVLNESIDGIRAALVHKASGAGSQAVVITSASRGEGKSTVASQLALSLGRLGQKTVLVDVDLRRPTLHRLLGASPAPGVSELLRGEAELEDVVQASVAANLDFLAAGQCSDRAIAALSSDALAGLVERLRADHPFILLDCGPVLATADVRLIGPQADGVILCVLRDVSCTPEIAATLELLTKFDAPILGAVVATKENAHYASYAYRDEPA